MTALDRTITLTFTHDDGLNIRMACNAMQCSWNDQGHAARVKGDNNDADTCFRIAAHYSRIWDMVAAAMNAPAPVHNGFHPPGFDPVNCEACAPAPARQDWRDRYGRPLVDRDGESDA